MWASAPTGPEPPGRQSAAPSRYENILHFAFTKEINMDNVKLANLLFPDVTLTPEDVFIV